MPGRKTIDVPRYVPPASVAPPDWAGTAATIALLGAGIVVMAGFVTNNPGFAVVLPATAIGAIACALRPAAATVGLIVLAGASGSLEAFFSLPTAQLKDFLLLGLWIGAIASHVLRPQRSAWLWPALFALALYIGLTLTEVVTAPAPSAGMQSFRVSAWPMTTVLLLAVAPWSQDTLRRIARWTLVVALGVGLYAVYRKVVGPAPEEYRLGIAAVPELPAADVRFFSSFPTAQHMALFCGTMLPFATALALAWTGRWRLIAALVLPLMVFCILASDVRTGTAAGAAGVLVTLFLFAVARGFPGGRRIAAVVVASFAVMVIGVGAYAVTVANNPVAASRFGRILTPTQDPTFEARQTRWNVILADTPTHPFGHGLGTAGSVLRGQVQSGVPVPIDLLFIDSTFVEIAYQQGIIVLVLFAAALLMLLGGLAWKGITMADPERSALAIGATGTLVAVVLFFYSSNYNEQLQMITPWVIIGLGAAQVRPFLDREREPREPSSHG